MKIYNQDKTQELNEEEIDFEKGHLISDKFLIAHHDAVEAHEAVYEDRVVIEANGATSIYTKLVTPAVEAKEEWDEFDVIKVFVPYTEKELAEREIRLLKAKLSETDYQAIKYAEGEMALAEYAETKAMRASWRKRINELEEVTR